MLKNNLLSLAWYVGIEIGVYLLIGLSIQPFGSRVTSWELVFSIPILIATPFLFILVGRYAIKSQGYSIKDLVSVLIVCIIGFLLTPGLAFLNTHDVRLSTNEFYFLYLAPLDETIMVFKNNWGSRDLLMVGKGVPGLLAGGVCSFIPTLLMWIGLRWQSACFPNVK